MGFFAQISKLPCFPQLLELPFCLPSWCSFRATCSPKTRDGDTPGCFLGQKLLQIVTVGLVLGGGTWLQTDFWG